MSFLSNLFKSKKSVTPETTKPAVPESPPVPTIEDIGDKVFISVTMGGSTTTQTLNEMEKESQELEKKAIDREGIEKIQKEHLKYTLRAGSERLFHKGRDQETDTELLNDALQTYIKAITFAVYANQQTQEVLLKCPDIIERILIVTRKVKQLELGYSALTWYRQSKFWEAESQSSKKKHETLDEKFKTLASQSTPKLFEDRLTECSAWLDNELKSINEQCLQIEYKLDGTIHLGDRCKKQNCSYCIPYDGLKHYQVYKEYHEKMPTGVTSKQFDKYLKEDPYMVPFEACKLKKRNDWGIMESQCDCWAEPMLFPYDLRDQLKIIEEMEQQKKVCDHQRGEFFVCQFCGLIMHNKPYGASMSGWEVVFK